MTFLLKAEIVERNNGINYFIKAHFNFEQFSNGQLTQKFQSGLFSQAINQWLRFKVKTFFLDRKMTPEYSRLWLNKGHKNLLYEFPIDIIEAVKYPTQIIIL